MNPVHNTQSQHPTQSQVEQPTPVKPSKKFTKIDEFDYAPTWVHQIAIRTINPLGINFPESNNNIKNEEPLDDNSK